MKFFVGLFGLVGVLTAAVGIIMWVTLLPEILSNPAMVVVPQLTLASIQFFGGALLFVIAQGITGICERLEAIDRGVFDLNNKSGGV